MLGDEAASQSEVHDDGEDSIVARQGSKTEERVWLVGWLVGFDLVNERGIRQKVLI